MPVDQIVYRLRNLFMLKMALWQGHAKNTNCTKNTVLIKKGKNFGNMLPQHITSNSDRRKDFSKGRKEGNSLQLTTAMSSFISQNGQIKIFQSLVIDRLYIQVHAAGASPSLRKKERKSHRAFSNYCSKYIYFPITEPL